MAKTRVVRKSNKKSDQKQSALRGWWSGLEQDQRHKTIRIFWKSFLCLLCLAAVGSALYFLQGYTLHNATDQQKIAKVCFAETPSWIPTQLLRKISNDFVTSQSDYRDEILVRNVYLKAVENPWISSVSKVRKFRDTEDRAIVEVNCEFRRPIAVVKHGSEYCYVDANGVRLRDSARDPEVPRWETLIYDSNRNNNIRKQFIEIAHVPSKSRAWRIPYIVIELHDEFDSGMPPVGKKWPSKALDDGLRLAKMLYQRKFSSQITRIDVRNHDGRISRNLEHIGFWAGRTYVKFGRFPHNDGVDWVVSPERKLANLDRYVAVHEGKLSGASGIDLQIDNIDDSFYGANIGQP